MFDEKFYDTLTRLQLQMSHKSSLIMSGSRKSVQKGTSAEFSDFREYMPGDDLRRMDWNVYARLDKLYIREYMEEKEASVTVLVDTSASMDYGERGKARLAKELAAVIGFLALNNMDRLMLWDAGNMGRCVSVRGGRNAFTKVLRWLEGLEFSGKADILSAAAKIQFRGPGVTVIISDFLHPDMLEKKTEKKAGSVKDVSPEKAERAVMGYERLLGYLRFCRQRPVILHTLAEEELRVTLTGAVNLIDSETGSQLRLTVDAKALESYQNQLSLLTERMKAGCRAAQGAYVLCDTGRDIRQLVFQDLRVIYDI
ncbi:MAG: DUF58 domain-containing protein [Acetatifactor sp.]|nr:DUF58 domain-containing protein [Acetatifactor sp.]